MAEDVPQSAAEAQADEDLVCDAVQTALTRALGGWLAAYPSEGMRQGVSRAVGTVMGQWLLEARSAGGVRHPADLMIEGLLWVEGVLQAVREALATEVYRAMHTGSRDRLRASGSVALRVPAVPQRRKRSAKRG